MNDKELAGLVAEAESERIEHLTQTNKNLNAQVLRLRNKQAELFAATVSAAQDAISMLSIPPVPPPVKDTRRKTPEVISVALGDWQLGKHNATYSSDVCEARIGQLADKVVQLAQVQRADHPVRECHVWCIGDLIEGELIFPGQAHEIDSSLFEQALVNGPRILGNFLRTMLANFDKVKVSCVMGNHGRIGGRSSRDMRPDNSGDRMLYVTAQGMLGDEKRLAWDIAESWYTVDTIGDKSWLLFHGDQCRGGFAGYPWYGFGKKLQGWRAGAVKEHFDYAIAGHYHQNAQMTLSDLLFFANGSPESSNVYAQENMASMGNPSQRVFFNHPKRGVTGDYIVWLD